MASPAETQILLGPFSRGERFLFHLVLFLIGSCNLVIINLARTPNHLWFWPWLGGWAVLLLIHGFAVAAADHLRRHLASFRRHRSAPAVGLDWAARMGASR
jgi:hypothetical protein